MHTLRASLNHIFAVNPALTWTSAGAQEMSELLESSPLYLDQDPVPMLRAHRVQTKFLNTHNADQIMIFEGKESHCIQSSLKLFQGKSIYHEL